MYQERLKVAGMGNKLASTQVTAVNLQRKGPASVSHCKSLSAQSSFKPRGWPTNAHDSDAEAVRSLTSRAVLVKTVQFLIYHLNFM